MNTFFKYASFVTCFIEATVLGSALFGWASLVFVLQEDGLYSYLCQITVNATSPASPDDADNLTQTRQLYQVESGQRQHNNRCPEQKVGLSVAYTVAIIIFGVGALPVGWFFDRFGLRATRTITAIIGVAGYVQLTFVTPGSEWLVIAGAGCIGISCYVIIMTTSYVALLAEPKASLMNAINNAGIGTSFAYPAVKLAYEHGVSRMVSLSVVAGLWGLVLLSTWFLLPAYKLEDEQPATPGGKEVITSQAIPSVSNGEISNWQVTPDSENILGREDKGITATQHPQPGALEDPNILRTYLLSATFILFLGWFCILHLRVGVMISGYDAWMSGIVKGNIAKVSYYTDVMAYAVLGGVLTTPIPGLITDYVRLKLSGEADGTATAMIPVLVLSSVLMSLLSACMLVQNEAAIFAATILFAVGKPCLYSTATSFVALLAPREHFGIVFGILNMISGVISFMIYPFLTWVAKVETFRPLNSLLLTMSLLSLILPVKLFANRWQHRQLHGLQTCPPGVIKCSHL